VRDATSDDAYYYLQIARNIAAGHGASFDGETLTNGFHPLWLLLVTPLHWLGDDSERVLHLALSLAALLGTATVLLVYAIVRLLTESRGAALIAAAFSALHPYLIVESVNGLETALSVFTLALISWIFLRLALRPAQIGPRAAIGLGAAAGVMMLARTDTVFVFGAILLYLLVRGRDADRLRVPLVAGGVATLLVAPWLIWNLARFGSIVQVSSLALAEPLREQVLAVHGDDLAAVLQRSWEVTRATFFERAVHLYFVPRGSSVLPFFGAVAALLAVLHFTSPASERRRTRQRVALLMVPGAGMHLALLHHVAVAHLERAVGLAPIRWRRAAIVALYVLVVVGFGGVFGPQQREHWVPPSPHRLQQLEAARWIERHTPDDARIGAFNAGLLGYFGGRTVVNLDGAVNADAYRAQREGWLMDYIVSKRIDSLVDWRGTLPLAGCHESPDVTCRRVAVLGEPLPGFAGAPIHVLEITRRSPRRLPPR
jgi:4-amino-4-deoxy-L-arabinose transferase-like glycosyltransferase